MLAKKITTLTAVWDRESGTGHPLALQGERVPTPGSRHRRAEVSEQKNVTGLSKAYRRSFTKSYALRASRSALWQVDSLNFEINAIIL